MAMRRLGSMLLVLVAIASPFLFVYGLVAFVQADIGWIAGAGSQDRIAFLLGAAFVAILAVSALG